ncbi:unnamed protein product [Prorocentrum cordatum]|uniref:Uncharacterized protein n=1 Tax=Prorocentrum cordatum TaxID=2364126 RepID=A0ABN9RWP3_9DINO|nr:unnamed protein product [Polarella glacialis]
MQSSAALILRLRSRIPSTAPPSAKPSTQATPAQAPAVAQSGAELDAADLLSPEEPRLLTGAAPELYFLRGCGSSDAWQTPSELQDPAPQVHLPFLGGNSAAPTHFVSPRAPLHPMPGNRQQVECSQQDCPEHCVSSDPTYFKIRSTICVLPAAASGCIASSAAARARPRDMLRKQRQASAIAQRESVQRA